MQLYKVPTTVSVRMTMTIKATSPSKANSIAQILLNGLFDYKSFIKHLTSLGIALNDVPQLKMGEITEVDNA